MPGPATEKSLAKHARLVFLSEGVAVVPLTQQFAATLVTASKAFQGQLQCWADKPPTTEYTGFQQFPGRRAEFRLNHSTRTRIGVLQPMAEEASLACLGSCKQW